MITTIAQPKRLPRPVFRPSLTLLAALLVMVVVGAALLMLNNGSRPDGNLGAGVLSQDSTDTPSPTNTFTPTPVPIMSEVPEEIPPAPVTTEMMTYVPTAYLTDTPTASPFMVSPTMIPENQSVEAEGGPLTATYIPAGAVAVPPSTLRLVVLAARDLPQGTEITQSDVILTYWPADTAPVGTFDGLVNLVPRYTTRDILRWQPIFEVDLK